MTDAWRGAAGDEPETVEEAAARFLVAGYSAGAMWFADSPSAHLDDFTDTGPRRNPTVMLVAEAKETEELASRYLTRDRRRWPRWLKRSSPDAQTLVNKWSAQHSMSVKRGGAIGEFVTWQHGQSFGAAPQRGGSYRAAIALADAKLTGPMLPLLRLYALQEVDQWPIVRRYCTTQGLDADACEVAIRRLLFASRYGVGSTDREARALGIRADVFRKRVNRAHDVLAQWLHTASWRFLKAHGWTPQANVTNPIPLARQPRRALPRFMHGIDWTLFPPAAPKYRRQNNRAGTGTPAPVLQLTGEPARAHCLMNPAQSHKVKQYFPLERMKIHDAYDLFGREAQNERDVKMTWERLYKQG